MKKLFIVFFIYILFLILFKKEKKIETFKLCKKKKFRIENLYCDRQTQRWYKPDYGWFIPGYEILNKYIN